MTSHAHPHVDSELRPDARPTLSSMVVEGMASARIIFATDGDTDLAIRLAGEGERHFDASAQDSAMAILLTNDRVTLQLVYGAIACGVTVLSLPLPPRSADLDAYIRLLRNACSDHGATRVIARDDVAELLSSVGLRTLAHSHLRSELVAQPSRDGFKLIQFTSGSTSTPKPVVLDDKTLGINVRAMVERVEPQPGDVTVSWLPLSHDMGLIGMLLTSTAAGSPTLVGKGDIVLMDPEVFVKAPRVWLDALDHWSGSFTASPDFGYRIASQRTRNCSYDLSRLRCSIVGGDVIRAATLRAMHDRFAASGLRREALTPAYGMAELGLAATMSPVSSEWHAEKLGLDEFANLRRAPARPGPRSVSVVSSGFPLTGYEVFVDSDESSDIGPICIKPPAAGRRSIGGDTYLDGAGLLRTGDIGFIERGQVFVCGRVDDYLVMNGRNVYAPDIEFAVSALEGVKDGRVAAVMSPTGEWALVLEQQDATATATTRDEIARDARHVAVSAGSSLPAEVVVLDPGQFPMTSSGKMQRREIQVRWLNGTLAHR